MKQAFRIIALFFIWLTFHELHAQVYPVNGNGVLIPPYSVYLADYTQATSDRLIVNVVLNDIARPQLDVRLRVKLIGQNITLETKPEYIGKRIQLQGGVPERLTGIDLSEYFNPNNLNFSNISRREFEKTGALPQGFYQFCFEVLEYNRGVKISNSICANGWLILNDPPIINLPRNSEKVSPTQPQNVVFQWTPRHTGSPNSAFSTEYEVKLVELWPPNRNPNDAILTSPPILEETTRATTFIYDVSQVPLELGRHYALQVKAKSIVGSGDKLDLFKNNGRSEVVTFIYGDLCNVPQNIFAEATSASRFTVKWTGDINHTGYAVRYRLADNPSAQWYTSSTLVPDAAISGLQPNTTYEMQVAGGCGVFESLYSGTTRIRTFDTGEQGYSCGMPLEQFNLDPANLIDALKVGDIIQAGDFDVKIAKVSGSGTFTGEGVIVVPFFNKAKVKAEFTGISVNKEMRMVSGYMNVTGAGVEIIPSGLITAMDELDEMLNELDTELTDMENNLPQPFDENAFVPDTTLTLPGPITVDTQENGSVVITDANGAKHTLPPGTEAAIVDDKGNGTLIDSQGNAHSVSGAVATAAANREYNLSLKFTESKTSQRYGFDALDEPNAEVFKTLANRYTKLEGEYYIPYKSVETGNTDVVVGVLNGSGIDKSKIRFEKGGVSIPSTPFSGNESTVTISANGNGEEEALIAVLPAANESQKDKVLGRVNVVSYSQISKILHIIPVNGNTKDFVTAPGIQTELNKIYSQAVVNWTVQLHDGIHVDGISAFNVGETGMLTNYTDHMKNVINVYKAEMLNDENNYYLFLVSNPSDATIDGVMPRSKNFGFIFVDKDENGTLENLARTMAHELGHGAFNLHHTFMEENFNLQKAETDNLMDYAGGTKLYKYQWGMMRYPPVVMGVFEDDAEGKSSLPCWGWFDDCDDVLALLNTIRTARIDGKYVVIKKRGQLGEKIYEGINFKVGDVDYNKIKVIFKVGTQDFNFNPNSYTYYNKQFFVASGNVDSQTGYVYYNGNEEWIKILVYDQDFKVQQLGDYLFGPSEIAQSSSSLIPNNRYVVFKNDANKREKTAPYNLVVPHSFLEKGREVDLISHFVEGDGGRMLVKYVGETEEYCTSTANLMKIVAVSDSETYKLKDEVTSLQTPYSENAGDKISIDVDLYITHQCGIYKRVSKKDNGKFVDLGWVNGERLRKYIDINNLTVAEFRSKFTAASSAAVSSVTEDWDTDEAACNLCVRAALYRLTGDAVLFPKVGSSITIRDGGEQIKGQVEAGQGSAQGIIDDLKNNNLSDYFEEIAKENSETYAQFWSRLQKLVDNSKTIIIGTYDPGHVFMVVPSGLWLVIDNSDREKSGDNLNNTDVSLGDRWGASFARKDFTHVLRIMDCGNGVKFSNGPMYGVMDAKPCVGEREGKVVKFYKYKGN